VADASNPNHTPDSGHDTAPSGAYQVPDAGAPTPDYTPETELEFTPDMSVPQPTAAVNPELKDLGADASKPKEMIESRAYINTYDKWLTEAEKKADNTQNSWYARSKERNKLSDAKAIVEGDAAIAISSGNYTPVLAIFVRDCLVRVLKFGFVHLRR